MRAVAMLKVDGPMRSVATVENHIAAITGALCIHLELSRGQQRVNVRRRDIGAARVKHAADFRK
jgi:hypothetical protein